MKSNIWLGLSLFFLIAGIIAHKPYLWIPATISLMVVMIIIIVQTLKEIDDNLLS